MEIWFSDYLQNVGLTYEYMINLCYGNMVYLWQESARVKQAMILLLDSAILRVLLLFLIGSSSRLAAAVCRRVVSRFM